MASMRLKRDGSCDSFLIFRVFVPQDTPGHGASARHRAQRRFRCENDGGIDDLIRGEIIAVVRYDDKRAVFAYIAR